jgi:PleD family two-component response regulator
MACSVCGREGVGRKRRTDGWPVPNNIRDDRVVKGRGERTEMAQRILLADDVPAVRQVVRALLEQEGFDVIGEAGNGQEAVRLGQALSSDVAILDLSMPLLNACHENQDARDTDT